MKVKWSKDLAHSHECSGKLDPLSQGAMVKSTVKGSDPESATHWEGSFEHVTLPFEMWTFLSVNMKKLYVPHSVINIRRDQVGYYYSF